MPALAQATLAFSFKQAVQIQVLTLTMKRAITMLDIETTAIADPIEMKDAVCVQPAAKDLKELAPVRSAKNAPVQQQTVRCSGWVLY